MRSLRPGAGGSISVLIAALTAGAPGCMAVPPPIVSPASQGPLRVALTWGGSESPGTAHIAAPNGATGTVRGVNVDEGWGDASATDVYGAVLVPAMASLHLADATGGLEIFTGWRDFGAGLRLPLVETGSQTLTALVLTAQSGWLVDAVEGSAAAEQSVALGGTTRALLRLGFGYGRRQYDVAVPPAFGAPSPGDGFYVSPTPHLALFRRDGRAEATAGVVFSDTVAVSIAPYVVVSHGGPGDVHCVNCIAGVSLVDFAASWGVALSLTVAAPVH